MIAPVDLDALEACIAAMAVEIRALREQVKSARLAGIAEERARVVADLRWRADGNVSLPVRAALPELARIYELGAHVKGTT